MNKGFGGKANRELAAVNTKGNSAIDSIGLSELTEDQQRQLQEELDRVFGSIIRSKKLRYTHLMEHDIDVGDAKHIKQRSYNYSLKVEEAMHQQVKELLEAKAAGRTQS